MVEEMAHRRGVIWFDLHALVEYVTHPMCLSRRGCYGQ